MERDNVRRPPIREKTKRIPLGKMDYNLILAVIALSLIGLIMVLSASTPLNLGDETSSPYSYFLRHGIYLIVSLIGMYVVSRINFNFYEKFAFPIYILTMVLCLLVFVPGLGVSNYGAYRWIRIFGISIMPSDYLKIGSIILMAKLIVDKKEDIRKIFKGVLPLIIFIGITVLPIYRQPDMSTLIVIGATLFGMMYLGGVNLALFIVLGILGVGAVLVGIFTSEYRMERVMSLFNPLEYRLDEGWQLVNALYGVASGGLTGRGIGKGISKQMYLSYQSHNDWIFSVIAEETGFIGSTIVMLIYFYMVYRGFRIAMATDDRFGKLLASGISLSLGMQGFINMGVAIGLVPSTGITLPFISYGGSALLASFIMVGILLNISRKNNEKKWIYR